MIYQRVLKEIEDNREKRLRGDNVTIPWSLPKISKVLPGIEKKRFNLITASPKAGKTQFTDFLYMYEPIEWMEKNPNTNIKLKIFYFSLEISKEAKLRAAMSHKLFKEYGIIISPQKLLSVFSGYILDENILGIVKSRAFTDWLERFESTVEIIDNVRNPFGIFNVVRNFAEQNGTYTYKDIEWLNEDGSRSIRRVKDFYAPNEPDLFVIIIVDHISLLQTEKGQNLHQAINTFSSEYCLHMRKFIASCYSNVA